MQQLLMGCLAAAEQAAAGLALEDFTASSFTVGTTATAQYRLSSDGSIDATQGSNTIVNNVGFWFEDVDSPSDYEVRATADPGSVSSGTLNTWQSLGTSRTWTLSSPTVSGNQEVALVVEIRRASDQEVLATATITLQCERGA